MKKMYLDQNRIDAISISLPCLIHGKDKSGASFFTMNFVLNYLSEGKKILFYSAFKPARDYLTENIPENTYKVVLSEKEVSEKQLIIPMSGDSELLLKLLKDEMFGDYIVVVKNVELLDNIILGFLKGKKNVVYSGNYLLSTFDWKKMRSVILFSDLKSFNISGVHLNKYQSFFVDNGILELK